MVRKFSRKHLSLSLDWSNVGLQIRRVPSSCNWLPALYPPLTPEVKSGTLHIKYTLHSPSMVNMCVQVNWSPMKRLCSRVSFVVSAILAPSSMVSNPASSNFFVHAQGYLWHMNFDCVTNDLRCMKVDWGNTDTTRSQAMKSANAAAHVIKINGSTDKQALGTNLFC